MPDGEWMATRRDAPARGGICCPNRPRPPSDCDSNSFLRREWSKRPCSRRPVIRTDW